MKQLAIGDDGNTVKRIWHHKFSDKGQIWQVMKFRSRKNRLLHCWLSCLRKGQSICKPPSSKSPQSEEGWKEALSAHLSNVPLDVFYDCQHLSLQQILARLAKIYERRESISALQICFDKSRRDPKDTFEYALKKLKIFQDNF